MSKAWKVRKTNDIGHIGEGTVRAILNTKMECWRCNGLRECLKGKIGNEILSPSDTITDIYMEIDCSGCQYYNDSMSSIISHEVKTQSATFDESATSTSGHTERLVIEHVQNQGKKGETKAIENFITGEKFRIDASTGWYNVYKETGVWPDWFHFMMPYDAHTQLGIPYIKQDAAEYLSATEDEIDTWSAEHKNGNDLLVVQWPPEIMVSMTADYLRSLVEPIHSRDKRKSSTYIEVKNLIPMRQYRTNADGILCTDKNGKVLPFITETAINPNVKVDLVYHYITGTDTEIKRMALPYGETKTLWTPIRFFIDNSKAIADDGAEIQAVVREKMFENTYRIEHGQYTWIPYLSAIKAQRKDIIYEVFAYPLLMRNENCLINIKSYQYHEWSDNEQI